MKIIIMIHLTGFLLTTGILSAQEQLDVYLETTAQNNPGLKARFSEYMASLEKVPQAGTLPDPQFAFGWFISPVETRMGPQKMRLSASQYFPWLGTVKAKENAAIQDARSKYELFEETRSKLFNEVKAVYYNLYLNKRSSEITGENIELMQSILRMTETRLEAGLTSPADAYRTKMEINELENQLILLGDQYTALETEFLNLLNASDTIEIIIPDSLWSGGLNESKQQVAAAVLNRNHKLLELEFRQQSLAFSKESARKSGMPGIKVGLDYIITARGENNLSGSDAIVFPAVGISLPLYRNKYEAMVREAAYFEEANRSRIEETHNMLEVLLERTWNDYTDAGRRIELYRKQLLLSEKALNILETEYESSYTGFTEILLMGRKVLHYKLEYEKAKADKQAAIAFMDYLTGK